MLLVPVRCASCGRPDARWCGQCRSLWGTAGFRCESGAGRLDLLDAGFMMPVWALAQYEGCHRNVILAAKAGGRHDVHHELARLLGQMAHERRAELRGDGARTTVVVPVPSSARAIRSRGAHLTATLAKFVAFAVRASPVDCLAARSRKRDQVGLGQLARARNLAGVIRAKRAIAGIEGCRAILVDDIVTSGATLARCHRVLTQHGVAVDGALVLAATRPPAEAVAASSPDWG